MRQPKHRNWVYVADGARSRLFESHGTNAPLELKDEWINPQARIKSSELGQDRPTRGRTIGSGAPFAVEEDSLHEQAKEQFLTEQAEMINQAHASKLFDHLVIAAAPAALGLLRKKIKENVGQSCIFIDKDLTNLSDTELRTYLNEHTEVIF